MKMQIKEKLEEATREHNWEQAMKRIRKELGLPANQIEEMMETMVSEFGLTTRVSEMTHAINKLNNNIKPRYPVSPYAKFDKHHKKKRK